MDLPQIEALLDNPNPQSRMKAIVELRHYEPAVVVPLLKQRMYDKQFMLRSFVAMGLGYKRNDEAYEALLEIISNETDHNVIAEAANSLAKFGLQAIPHLVAIFEQKSHWLVHLSIFAAMEDFDCPEVLLEMCRQGFNGEDLTVRLIAVSSLSKLQGTPQADDALEILLQAVENEDPQIRAAAAKVLRQFGGEQVQAVLAKLRHDIDHRVVAAVLEGLL